jgi:hypothetical protein
VETQGLVRLLRLELECNHYAASTVREYTRLEGLRSPPHPLRGGVADSRDEDTCSGHGVGSGRIGL